MQEFIRVGYYVSNEYSEDELRESPPEVPILEKLTRVILAESPRVTRFPCEFDKPQPIPGTGQGHENGMDHETGGASLAGAADAVADQLQQLQGPDGMSQDASMGEQ